MAAVIELRSPIRTPRTVSFRAIRRGSRGLEILFAVLLIALAATTAISIWVILFYQGNHITLGPKGGLISDQPITDVAPFRSWALDQKLAYCVVAIVRPAPSLCLFWFLRGLFHLYAEGVVFSGRNARTIKAIGACLLADALAPWACHVVLSLTGYEIDKLWLHMASVQELVLGAVVFVVALVMQAACDIEEDRAGFV